MVRSGDRVSYDGGLNQDLGKIHLSILAEIKCCIRLKGLDVNLNITGVERICSENLCLWSKVKGI